MKAAAAEELVDLLLGRAEFGGVADDVLSFDGIPVAALWIAEAGDVDWFDGPEDVFGQLACFLLGVDVVRTFEEACTVGAEAWVVAQKEGRCEFRFAEAACGLRKADCGKIEQGERHEDGEVVEVCIESADELRGSEKIGVDLDCVGFELRCETR